MNKTQNDDVIWSGDIILRKRNRHTPKTTKKISKQGKKISTSAVSNNQVTKAGNLADTEFFS